MQFISIQGSLCYNYNKDLHVLDRSFEWRLSKHSTWAARLKVVYFSYYTCVFKHTISHVCHGELYIIRSRALVYKLRELLSS